MHFLLLPSRKKTSTATKFSVWAGPCQWSTCWWMCPHRHRWFLCLHSTSGKTSASTSRSRTEWSTVTSRTFPPSATISPGPGRWTFWRLVVVYLSRTRFISDLANVSFFRPCRTSICCSICIVWICSRSKRKWGPCWKLSVPRIRQLPTSGKTKKYGEPLSNLSLPAHIMTSRFHSVWVAWSLCNDFNFIFYSSSMSNDVEFVSAGEVEQNWTCNHCTFINSRELPTCEICNLPR